MLIAGIVVDNSIIPVIDLSTFQGVAADMEDNRFPFNVVHCTDPSTSGLLSVTIPNYVQKNSTPFIVCFTNSHTIPNAIGFSVNNGTYYTLKDRGGNDVKELGANVLYVIRYTYDDDEDRYEILGIVKGIAGRDIYGSGVIPDYEKYDFVNHGIVGGAVPPIEIDDIGRITHKIGSGYNHIPSGGSNNQILTYKSAGTAQWENIDAVALPISGGTITGDVNVRRSHNLIFSNNDYDYKMRTNEWGDSSGSSEGFRIEETNKINDSSVNLLTKYATANFLESDVGFHTNQELVAQNKIYSNANELFASNSDSNVGGYIDFHYNQTINTNQIAGNINDYSTRIIEDKEGQINIQASTAINSKKSAILKVEGKRVYDESRITIQTNDVVVGSKLESGNIILVIEE